MATDPIIPLPTPDNTLYTLFRWASSLALTPSQKSVLKELLLYVDWRRGDRCFVPAKKLAHGTGYSRSTIQRVLGQLEGMGIITADERHLGQTVSRRLVLPEGVSHSDTPMAHSETGGYSTMTQGYVTEGQGVSHSDIGVSHRNIHNQPINQSVNQPIILSGEDERIFPKIFGDAAMQRALERGAIDLDYIREAAGYALVTPEEVEAWREYTNGIHPQGD